MENNYGQNTTFTPAPAPAGATGGKTKKGLIALIVALVLVAVAAISAAVYFGLSGAQSEAKVEKPENVSELREDIVGEKDTGEREERKEVEEKSEVKTEETVIEDEMQSNIAGDDEKKLRAVEVVEAKDDFEVKITNKSIVEDMGGLSFEGGPDGLILTIENRTSEEVKEVEIYAVGYKADEGWAFIESGFAINPYGNGRSGDQYIKIFTTSEDFSILGRSSEDIVLKCSADGFIAIKAIVSSYTTDDGTVHKNPIVEEWVKAVAGISDAGVIR